jgi:hypothetical protein
MTKRGRPRKNGVQPVGRFGRTLRVILVYNEARAAGLKHSSAVTQVARTLAISESEVKQTVADYQHKGDPVAFIVKKSAEPKLIYPEFCKALGIPEGSKMKNGFIFGFGPRPQYPRINARNSEKSCSPTEK